MILALFTGRLGQGRCNWCDCIGAHKSDLQGTEAVIRAMGGPLPAAGAKAFMGFCAGSTPQSPAKVAKLSPLLPIAIAMLSWLPRTAHPHFMGRLQNGGKISLAALISSLPAHCCTLEMANTQWPCVQIHVPLKRGSTCPFSFALFPTSLYPSSICR